MFKRVYALIVLVFITSVLVLSSGCSGTGSNTNGAGNYLYGGSAETDGEWVFYGADVQVKDTRSLYSYHYETRLFKIKTNGLKQKQISDKGGQGINISKGWVYFIGSDNCIYKVRANGSDTTKVAKFPVSEIRVKDDWIYFINWFGKPVRSDWKEASGIFKIRTDGTGMKKLSTSADDILKVEDDWVYYVAGDVYKMKPDGSSNTLLCRPGTSRTVNLVGDTLYFSKELIIDGKYTREHRMYRMKINGGKETQLCNDNCTGLNVVDNWIYYINTNDNNRIYKISTDGSKKTRLGDDTALSLNIAGGWIYYKAKQTDVNGRFTGWKRARLKCDGSAREYVE